MSTRLPSAKSAALAALALLAPLAFGADDAAALKAQAATDFEKAAKLADEASQLQVTARNELAQANAKEREAETAAKLPKEQVWLNELHRRSDANRQAAKTATTEAQAKQALAADLDKTIQTLTTDLADAKTKKAEPAEITLLDEELRNDQRESKAVKAEADRLTASAKQLSDSADKYDAELAKKASSATAAATAKPAAASATPPATK